MSDRPNGLSIRELRMLLIEAEKIDGGDPANIPVLIEVKGRKKPLKLDDSVNVGHGVVFIQAK